MRIKLGQDDEVVAAVIRDLTFRRELGLARYGKPLVLGIAGQHDPLAEAYAEALDMCIYLRWAMSLREGRES